MTFTQYTNDEINDIAKRIAFITALEIPPGSILAIKAPPAYRVWGSSRGRLVIQLYRER